MTTSQPETKLPNERTIELTRLYNAPRALVWKAWTEAKHVQRWWVPQGFDNPVCEWDARPGGKILIKVRGPDGTTFVLTGEFTKVMPQERLEFDSAARDLQNTPLLEAHAVVTLSDHAGKTKLVLTQSAKGLVPFAPQMLAVMEMGWNQQLDTFGTFLATL